MKIRAPFFVSIIIFSQAICYDTPHYYLPTSFFNVPRIDRNCLSTCELYLESGHAHKGFGAHGHRSSLLLDCSISPYTKSDFSILSTTISMTQNLTDGFFVQANLPIKTYSFLIDNSALIQNTQHGNKAITHCLNQTGIGDLTMLFGFTRSTITTKQADFFDYTIQIGILAPTGKKKDPFIINSIPLGYDGKTAMLATIIGAIGYFEWLTVGIFNQGIFFITQDPTGPLIHIAPYILADHFIRGLSFGIASSYIQQFGTPSKKRPAFLQNHTNNPWQALTVHLFAEYEFTQENWKVGPRIGMGYHTIIKGKSIFRTKNSSILFGMDLIW